ncbi:MAG: ribonuclease catalytic domain-containing protein [Marinilabiliales bacterium]|nr:ribonuclease catalytic domain-containing protein [Marinilabiliales bacterium]
MKEQLLTLNNLAQTLRSKRFASGSFAFERLEVKFNLSEKGVPLGILFREFGTSNQLIEEFMLLANKRVAEYVGKKLKGKTFVYRIHDKPNPEKLSSFSYFIKRFGYAARHRECERTAGSHEQADGCCLREKGTEYHRDPRPALHGQGYLFHRQHRPLRSCLRPLHPLHLAHQAVP